MSHDTLRLFRERAWEIPQHTQSLVSRVNFPSREAKERLDQLLEEVDRYRRRLLALPLPSTGKHIDRPGWEWDMKEVLEIIQKACQRLASNASEFAGKLENSPNPEYLRTPEFPALHQSAVQENTRREAELRDALDRLWRLEQDIDQRAPTPVPEDAVNEQLQQTPMAQSEQGQTSAPADDSAPLIVEARAGEGSTSDSPPCDSRAESSAPGTVSSKKADRTVKEILALDSAGLLFSFDPQGPNVKSWTRPKHPLDNPFQSHRLYLASGQWCEYRTSDPIKEALFPPGSAPNYGRVLTREGARDWFLAASMPLPDELADLRPAQFPTPVALEAAPNTEAPRRELNKMEQKILSVCRKAAYKGDVIARKVDRSPDYVRHLLARLVNDGLLKNDENGYRTTRK